MGKLYYKFVMKGLSRELKATFTPDREAVFLHNKGKSLLEYYLPETTAYAVRDSVRHKIFFASDSFVLAKFS